MAVLGVRKPLGATAPDFRGVMMEFELIDKIILSAAVLAVVLMIALWAFKDE